MLPKDHELFKQATESDGAHNDAYCAFCYENGAFTDPENSSAKEM